MSVVKKIIFATVPAIVLFGTLEIGCLIWEKLESDEVPREQADTDFPKREAGELRVLFFGGSTIQGVPEETVGFVAQLQAYLEGMFPERVIRFYNYGASGKPSAYVLRKLDQTIRNGDADALVVMTAHNEFFAKEEYSEEELKALYAIEEQLYRSALARRARRLVYRYHTARRRENLSGDSLKYTDPNSERYKERVALYYRNLDTIIEIAQKAGKPLFLLTAPSNVKDWAPSDRQFSFYADDPEYLSAVGEVDELLRERRNEDGLRVAEDATARFPGDALLTFGMAQAKLKLGRGEEARELFYQAKDLDPLPYRVLTRFNDAAREKEGEEGVTLIDIARLFDDRSPEGITGFKLIVDNCHPAPEGGYLMATTLIDRFADAGLVEKDRPAAEMVSLERFLGTEDRTSTWVKYNLNNARLAMKPPFLNFREAERYLKQAMDLDPENWEVNANVATILFLKGAVQDGERYLRKAVEMKGERIDFNDRETVPYLKEAMEKAGYGAGN